MTRDIQRGFDERTGLEEHIAQWRVFLLRRRAVDAPDVEELEDHLRSQVADLVAAGLSPDEAFLVGVKRLGSQDEISREFARVHSGRLWKQLALAGGPAEAAHGSRVSGARETVVVIALAVAAALAIKLPVVAGPTMADAPGFYVRNGALLVLAPLSAYFVWKRHLGLRATGVVVAGYVIAGLIANLYPFVEGGAALTLTALHLPMFLWIVLGVAYVGGEWRSEPRRMDFIRFTGEWVIYMSLLALGGGVLMGLTVGTFNLLGQDASGFVDNWMLPCGVAGAIVIAAWLVEAKQGVIENMAPVLTRVFTPLIAALLIALIVTISLSHSWVTVDRDALVVLDLLLVVVVGLALYSISARGADARVGIADRVQVVLVGAALVVDGIVLASVLARISEWGFTANRTAALGENLVLLVNLAWTAWMSLGFLRRRQPFAALERWQTSYVPVYGAWALVVAALFPLIFGFT